MEKNVCLYDPNDQIGQCIVNALNKKNKNFWTSRDAARQGNPPGGPGYRRRAFGTPGAASLL